MKIKEWEIDPVSLFSHELKTPLSSLRMGLDLIQSQPKKERQRIVSLMKVETERMIELVCGHLDQRLLKDGQTQTEQAQNKRDGKRPELLRFSWIPWEAAVSQALAAAKLAAEEKGLFFQVKGQPFKPQGGGAWPLQKSGAPGGGAKEGGESGAWVRGKGRPPKGFLEVFGDQAWLAQALGNLLSNAIKASPKGGSLFIDWGFSFERGLNCSVADEGGGLSPEAAASLFKAWPPGSESSGGAPKSRAPGRLLKSHFLKSHGMGLGIARGIAEAHGGQLRIGSPDKEGQAKSGKAASKKGRGAVFWLSLPLARLRTESADAESKPSLEPGKFKPGKLKKAG